jgi:hypothetical protein
VDPLIRLAANAAPKERRYVLIAGAGVSKDAGQATGWDILLETARLIRAAEGGDQTQSIEEWFLASPHARESYASMVEALYPNPAEQQAFLARSLHVTKPGRAHEAIAELARRGVLRAIITSNFDDLLERALRTRGLDVQVVASEADFEHVSPLIHCTQFRVYKPHGTLGLGTLRNTPADVAALPAPVATELQRVLDDHGLIVVGYAGADPGIMDLLSRRRRNLYPVYWMHLEEQPPNAATAALNETLVSVPITGGGTALEMLLHVQDSLARMASTGSLLDPAPAVAAISGNRKDTVARVRDFMRELGDAIARVSPRPDEMSVRQYPEADETFVRALSATEALVVEFARVAHSAAEHDSVEACKALREELHGMRRLYKGERPQSVHDFIRFLTQEMFVILVTSLVRNRRWSTLAAMLAHLCLNERSEPEKWTELNRYIEILDQHRKQRLGLRRLSVAADLYHERHSGDRELARIVPIDDLVSADLLLTFITGYAPPPGEPEWGKWLPRITLGTSDVPEWLARMRSRAHADQVLSLLEMPPVEIEQRRQFFIQHFDQTRTMNQRVWTGGFLRSPGDFDRELKNELFSRP